MSMTSARIVVPKTAKPGEVVEIKTLIKHSMERAIAGTIATSPFPATSSSVSSRPITARRCSAPTSLRAWPRQGQLNLACTQCHDESWGRKLRGDMISQGRPTGFPIYRLEWQSLGSLHGRLRACSLGVRAEVPNYGAPEYLALKLYLAWRARGMPIETPAIRR